MVSEFQAGWLQDADQPLPRPADPSNTTLALHTLLQMGAHGIVNFPVQDTLNPAGWEAPWTNAFYSWDAALSVQLTPQARYAPTARFGELIRDYGADLARTHRADDAAIAYLTSAYDSARISNSDVAAIAQATMQAQRGCRIMRISCALVDLRFISPHELGTYKVLIVPPTALRLPYIAAVRSKLTLYRAGGGRVVPSARVARVAAPVAGGIPDAALLVSSDRRFGFLDIVNYGRTPLHTKATRVHEGTFAFEAGAQTVPPRNAVLVPLGAPVTSAAPAATAAAVPAHRHDRVPLRTGSWVGAALPQAPGVYRADVYRDGYPAAVFQTPAMRLLVSPCAGARALVFEDRASGENLFTTVGGLRDAWLNALPPSPRDYIAKYTHPIATGTFNRCYTTSLEPDKRAAIFSYDAPDAPPHGAVFRKTVAIDANASFTVTLDASFPRGAAQRAQQLTSFAVNRDTKILRSSSSVGFFDRRKKRLLLVDWSANDVRNAELDVHAADALLTLTLSRSAASIRYSIVAAPDLRSAEAASKRGAGGTP
jgi:hypothetical protein